jgi:hypothetical protein
MPAALGAIIAFIFALAFHIAGGKVAQYVTDAELIGFILLAVAVAWLGWWDRRGPRT